MIPAYLSPLANHLWQSTLFACAAGLLTLTLRKNPARVRHWGWAAASLKFFVPFSLLISLGSQVRRTTTPGAFTVALDQLTRPFAAPAASPASSPMPLILMIVWAIGFIRITGSYWIRWRRVAAVVRAGSPLQLEIPIQTISSPAVIEPGVFGLFQPVLLLPHGIFEQLTPEQMKAVIAHELCHVRHRDNVVAVLHMFVEAVFWFYPPVWWIGKRILDERERACDEEVLRLGCEPQIYAQGILRVCELYLESPVACVSGVTGANLKNRIRAIMGGPLSQNLTGMRKAMLAAAGALAVILPVMAGFVDAPRQDTASVPVRQMIDRQVLPAESVPPDRSLFEPRFLRDKRACDEAGSPRARLDDLRTARCSG